MADPNEPDLDASRRRHDAIVEQMSGVLRFAFGERPPDPAPVDPGPPDLPPDSTVLGDFCLLREIGQGGMGVVYEAHQISLNRRVALKVLPDHITRRPAAVERFRREAALAANLAHPGIVEIHTVGTESGTHYFAMEFVEGAPLDRVIDRSSEEGLDSLTGDSVARAVRTESHRLDTGEAEIPGPSPAPTWNRNYIATVVEIAAQVAEALEHAHRAGVVHRDVKPANILVRADGTVKLTDFGLARQEDLPSLTRSGEFGGTPYYTSPEQAAGRTVDHRTDVFSLGATLYELLTLRRPFSGETTREVLNNILAQEPGDPQKLNPGVAPDLAAVVLRALEKDPERRYSSAGALAEDLRAFLEYRPVTARRISAAARAVRWSRRHRAITATVLGSAAVLLAAGVWFVLSLHAKNVELTLARDEARENARQAEANAERARASALEASVQAKRAREKQHEAERHLADFTRMADVRRLADLKRAASDELWPAVPGKVPAMEAWLARAKTLAGRLEIHEATLAALLERAFPYTKEERRADIRAHPDGKRYIELLQEVRHKKKAHAELISLGHDRARNAAIELQNRILQLGIEIRRMELRIHERRWRIGTLEERWQHEVLTYLLTDLEAFLHPVPGPDFGTVADVRQRMAFARNVKRKTIDEHAEDWKRAIRSIADRKECPAYRGLEIKPQLGLIPIGRDPESGLWEFAHLQTGEPPERDPNKGEFVITGQTGLVFVLLPGGAFQMGAERPSPERPLGTPNTDPYAMDCDGPVHRVELSPFFLSKYEMTQGQWLRVAHENPSAWYRDWKVRHPNSSFLATLLAHPVETVDWVSARRVLHHLGLVLPTEAQWEYGARGGTDTIWWTGNEKESLRGAGNLLDGNLSGLLPDNAGRNDGYQWHAPVHSFRPNPFGLHNICGNVSEWCADQFRSYNDPTDPKNGERQGPPTRVRAIRGAGYENSELFARSAVRQQGSPEIKGPRLGVRPARVLED